MSRNQGVVLSQPQWQNGTATYPQLPSKPTPMVPPGLECLVEVEDVLLKDKVFQTRNGQILFMVQRQWECCGPSFNLRLRDPYQRDALSLSQDSTGFCGGQRYLKISAPPSHPIGYVLTSGSSSRLSVSIQMGNRMPIFSAELPLTSEDNSAIQIIGTDRHFVASILKEKDGQSSQVLFRFPMDMEATLKALILGAFLYTSFRVQELISYNSRQWSDDSWATAGGMDYADFGGDWGGDGGGDCGDGGGDCGGGDCGGGDGGGGDGGGD